MSVNKNIRPFHTVLVANRGEIALRVLRTVRRMGFGSVAVYSEADRNSPHVQAADRAVCIGPAAPAQSYLNIDAIIPAAQLAGANAIHPGYGFLSENDAFADAVDAAGLVFIGPSGDNIRAMGNKAGAKRLMQAAGMPCIPGYEGPNDSEGQSDETFVREAERIGFPIMCKAAAGGGGRGMRLVQQASDLPAALASARSEARTAFGSAELILERAVRTPRHVEIQLLADNHGHVVHLGERDCSVQRRHQKVIEEAPSPAVDAALRQRMGEAAVHSARTLGYIGAGTMEFLLDADGQFYFMEMNTRLQVEHAVTEAITGLDLVEWQLRVAAGEALAFAQQDIQLDGHAIEVRLTAEDVPAGFLPQTGPVLRWRPPVAHDVRIDSALIEGGEVSPHYDSMVAKLVAHGRDREEARRKLLSAVRHCVLLGLPSNQVFLADCLSDAVFVEGVGVHTGFVAERMGMPPAAPLPSTHTVALAALAAQVHNLPSDAQGHLQASALAQGQAMGLLQWGEQRWHYRIQHTASDPVTAWQVQCTPQHAATEPFSLSLTHVQWLDSARSTLAVECDGLREQICIARTDTGVQLFHQGRAWTFECPPTHRAAGPEAGSGAVLAPLTARVLQVMVTPGQTVQAGERLLVLEAMKMEHTLTAPFTGVVRELLAQAGGQALKGALLMQIEAEAG
ncbi:MAG: ATP-grasp domain-containing protein [Polaromonas sp.]|nr:ATP-grasp domain-containing protein [Polaromonas sp.]